jgi:hypothetical protein
MKKIILFSLLNFIAFVAIDQLVAERRLALLILSVISFSLGVFFLESNKQ